MWIFLFVLLLCCSEQDDEQYTRLIVSLSLFSLSALSVNMLSFILSFLISFSLISFFFFKLKQHNDFLQTAVCKIPPSLSHSPWQVTKKCFLLLKSPFPYQRGQTDSDTTAQPGKETGKRTGQETEGGK